MKTMTRRPIGTAVVTGLVTVLAIILFVHTAIARRDRALARLSSQAKTSQPSEVSRWDASLSGRFASSDEDRIANRLRTVMSLAVPVDRTRSLLKLLKELDDREFPFALKACLAIANDGVGAEYRLILGEWARRDPRAALAYCANRPTWMVPGFTEAEHVVRTWVVTDPDAAITWIKEEQDPKKRSDLLSLAVGALSASDLHRSLELFKESSGMGLQGLLSHPKPETIEAISEWIDEKKDPSAQAQAAKAVMSFWWPPEPERMFQMLSNYPGAMDEESLQPIFKSWGAGDDAQSAISAVDQMPSGPALDGALHGLIPGLILQEKLDEAKALIDRYPDSITDKVLSDSSGGLSRFKPEQAIEFAEAIKDPFKREESIDFVLYVWSLNDETASKAWQEAHGKTAADRFESRK